MKFFQKPGADLVDRVPPGQHLASGFPVLTYGSVPEVSQETWQVRIWGLVPEQVLTWNDLMAMPLTVYLYTGSGLHTPPRN